MDSNCAFSFENIQEIFDIFIIVNNSDGIEIFNQIEILCRIKIIKVLYMKNFYEEARILIRYLANENSSDKSINELFEYFEKNKFLW